jgi:hypothetical protein
VDARDKRGHNVSNYFPPAFSRIATISLKPRRGAINIFA